MVGKFLAFSLAVILASCGHLRSTPRYTSYGEADPDKDDQIVERYFDLKGTNKKIKVLIDTIPEGIVINGGNIINESGYDHKLLGQIYLSNSRSGDIPLGFSHQYRTGWRNPYCKAQVPLIWVTAMIWAIIVPLNYPCRVGASTKAEILEDVKVITAAAGGDMAIVSYINWGQKDVFGAIGYIIKMDPKFQGKQIKTKKQDLSPTEKKL